MILIVIYLKVFVKLFLRKCVKKNEKNQKYLGFLFAGGFNTPPFRARLLIVLAITYRRL